MKIACTVLSVLLLTPALVIQAQPDQGDDNLNSFLSSRGPYTDLLNGWVADKDDKNGGIIFSHSLEITRVELMSFTLAVGNNCASLLLQTATEKNNYSFPDKEISSGEYQYNLKQIDCSGSFKYSIIIFVNVITSGNRQVYLKT